MKSGTGTHQQGDYGDHNLSYFDHGTRAHSHSIAEELPEDSKIDPQSHPMKTSEGSPPPTSATTSGSTSTPTSVAGLSSGGDGNQTDLTQEILSPSSHYPQHTHPQSGETWPVSTTEGIIAQSYSDGGALAMTHGGAEVGFSDDPDARNNPTAYPSAIKLLVSNNVAGSIIGRSGQTISELQTQSSARIKLSQTGDYYPGTQDRVCLVHGQIENVKFAVQLLLERLFLLQGQQHSQHLAWQPKGDDATVAPAPVPHAAPTAEAPSSFDFVVRLLVPSSSCGMIIGKSGANIKHMEESSGVSSVRLSPKEGSDPNTPTAAIASGTLERVVTLTGPTLDSCLRCLCIVLDGMAANHELCRYTNMTTSYSRLIVPGAYTPVAQPGRPLLLVPSPTAEWEASGPYGQFTGKRSNSQPDLAQMAMDQQLQSRIPPESPNGPALRLSSRESIQQYSPVFHDGPQAYSTDTSMMMPSPTRAPQPISAAGHMYLGLSPSHGQMEHQSMQNSSSAPDLLTLQFQENMRISNPTASAPVDYTHFAPQLPQPTPPGFTAQVLVPDTLIGSILGRGGSTLNELQMHSNTRIRISQRGEYVPGTRKRIVTIRGPSAHSVSLAQYLMSQRMILPPTASYSPQPTPFHPSQLQSQPQRLSAHQAPHQTQAHAAAQFPHDHHPQHHDRSFRPTDRFHDGASNAPAPSSSK